MAELMKTMSSVVQSVVLVPVGPLVVSDVRRDVSSTHADRGQSSDRIQFVTESIQIATGDPMKGMWRPRQHAALARARVLDNANARQDVSQILADPPSRLVAKTSVMESTTTATVQPMKTTG